MEFDTLAHAMDRVDDFYNYTNSTDLHLMDNHLVQALFYVFYTMIFVLGLFGNVLVCYVVCRNSAMQTVTNFFITNMALSDILLCVLAVPFTPTYTFLGRWVFGSALCHVVPYAQGCSVYISTLTLSSIAIDRYFVIIHPFQPRMLVSTCILIISGIWVFSLIVTFPYGLYMDIYELYVNDLTSNAGQYVQLCEESWPTEHSRKVFGALTTLLQFLIPFMIITFCYIRVSIRLNNRSRARRATKNTRKEEADRDRKRHTNRMLIAMVTVFGISWLPLNAINIMNDFFINTAQWKYYHLAFFMSHSLAMSSTCYNTFLYAWLNENFRKEFKQVLPCFDRVKRSGGDRMGNWGAEPTCNGLDTMQETLLTTSTVVRRPSECLQEMHMVLERIAIKSDALGVIQEDKHSDKNTTEEEPTAAQIITMGTKCSREPCTEHRL